MKKRENRLDRLDKALLKAIDDHNDMLSHKRRAAFDALLKSLGEDAPIFLDTLVRGLKRDKQHVTNGNKCWCNPKVISFKHYHTYNRKPKDRATP